MKFGNKRCIFRKIFIAFNTPPIVFLKKVVLCENCGDAVEIT